MQKIAIISDIHGNLPALRAVLNDIETEYDADKIFCLGDLVDGVPWHNEVIDIIREKGISTVMGNHDERLVLDSKFILMPKHTPEETQARLSTYEHTKKTIRAKNKEFLATFPHTINFEYAGINCLLTHGSPRSNRHYVFEDHENEEEIRDWFRDHQSDIILMGHTHYSYIRAIDVDGANKTCINVGSVGRSKEAIGAKAVYLWLTIETDGKVCPVLRKIDYNVHEAIRAIKESPISDFYADFFEKHLND